MTGFLTFAVVSATAISNIIANIDNNNNNNNNNDNNDNDKNNPHLNFLKETVLGDKELGVGVRDKGQRSKDKG